MVCACLDKVNNGLKSADAARRRVAVLALATRLEITAKEFANQIRDLGTMRLKGEVAGIEKMNLRVRDVALVGRGTGCDEDGIVLAPNDQRRRLALAEVGLPLRIQRDVGAVVIEQVELDLRVARAVEQRLVHRPGIGAYQRCVLHAVRVLPLGGLDGG